MTVTTANPRSKAVRRRAVHGVATTRTLIAFRTYSRHDLDRMFSVGFEAGQPD
jgi:hypothetical protein